MSANGALTQLLRGARDEAMTPVSEILPVVSPSLARRKTRCKVCQSVAAVEDVNARALDEQHHRRRGYVRLVREYLTGIGVTVSDEAVIGHVKHVLADLESPPRRTLPDRVTRLSPEDAPVAWFDVTEQGMSLGMDALRDLRARLPDLEDKDLIAVAKMGLSTAGKRADIEARGKAVGATLGALAALASGHVNQVEVTSGNTRIRARLGEGRAGVSAEDRHGDH